MTVEVKKQEYQKKFNNDGFVVATAHTDQEIDSIQDFALSWVSSLLNFHNNGPLPGPIDTYHIWKSRASINHNQMLSAQNRHTVPSCLIKNQILTNALIAILTEIAPGIDFELWDEGLGWLAFRLIRPAHNDGYPWSCKSWGPAKNSMSVWLPVIGCGPDETIALWPGSHTKTLGKFMPKNSKFTKDEFRLSNNPPKDQILRPVLKKNEIIIFGPKTVHSENVEIGNQTRVNLEFRFNMSPKKVIQI